MPSRSRSRYCGGEVKAKASRSCWAVQTAEGLSPASAVVGWNPGSGPAVGGAEPGSPAASCGGNSARLQQDGRGHSANESCGRGFLETSWKPGDFGLHEVFANDNEHVFDFTARQPIGWTPHASPSRHRAWSSCKMLDHEQLGAWLGLTSGRAGCAPQTVNLPFPRVAGALPGVQEFLQPVAQLHRGAQE